LKSFVYIITAAMFVYSRVYLKDRGLFKGEYFVLGLFGMLGTMVMISEYSFITLYLGLELLSLSLYAMVAFNRDSGQASEAAMKYFVLGAIASGMLLYGMSILYGMSGTLNIAEVARYLAVYHESNVPLLFGLSFVIVGIAFKLGAAPFHMWLPDVYHGAPTPVTLYIGTISKIGAFAMFMRLIIEGLGQLQADWQGMLVLLTVLSLALGNVVAVAQVNIKRMLAYSAISHVGFVLLGILAGTPQGYAAAMFYMLIYALTALGAFGMILLLTRKGFEAENLEDFKGLSARSPWFAFMMLLLMFSMTGVPLTVGFYAKLSVLQAVTQVGMVWLAIYAVVFSIIGAFYYLRVVWFMYFTEPETDVPLPRNRDMNVALSINGLAMLGLFLFPGGLMSLCAMAVGD
ncbi:MAG TPA: NADH-quinone oxidoreductase subunit NuoN, partial [Gammaproteobacteria bacterium]|nr:NADH-quinone oxidoreductase subunit NuoN [Gammaproteobacteria bacterium]